jgi:hypothetical protein
MVSKQILLQHLPPFTNKQILIEAKQEVPDIMREVIEAHKYFANDYDLIAEFFDTGSILDFCKNLFDFCKSNIYYKVEKEEKQTTKSPAAILTTGEGDCKHYAGFIAGNLQALERITGEKINWCYRFASYSMWDSTPAHVFVVCKIDGKDYWIDPVLNSFNSRSIVPVSFVDEKVKNKKMSLTRLSGLGFMQVDDLQQNASMLPILYSDDYLQTNAVTQTINIPENIMSDPGAEPLDPELENNIKMLLYYGIIDANMNISNDVFVQKMSTLDEEDANDLGNAYGDFLQRAKTVGNIFGDIWNSVKQIAGAPERGAYLSLVSLNVFGMATKLNKCITKADGSTDQAGIDKLQGVWHGKLMGDTNILLRAIRNGAAKKAILGINIIGVAAAVAPAWIAAATAIIAAMAPIISSVLKAKQNEGYPNITASDFSNLSMSTSSSLTDQLKKYAPFILIGGVGLYLYLDRKKK